MRKHMAHPSQGIPLFFAFAVFLFGGQSIDKEAGTWGEPVEGGQCGLRLADKSHERAVPLLLVDVRNTGKSYFSVGMCEESGFEVLIDGAGHRWRGPTDAPYSYLPPGRSYTGLIFDLSREGWWFDLPAGKHAVQVVALLLSASPPDQHIVRGRYLPDHPMRVSSKELVVAFPKPIVKK